MTHEYSSNSPEFTVNPQLVVAAAAVAVKEAMQEAPADARSALVDELQNQFQPVGLTVVDEEKDLKVELERGARTKRTRGQVIDDVMIIRSGRGISRLEASIRDQRKARRQSYLKSDNAKGSTTKTT